MWGVETHSRCGHCYAWLFMQNGGTESQASKATGYCVGLCLLQQQRTFSAAPQLSSRVFTEVGCKTTTTALHASYISGVLLAVTGQVAISGDVSASIIRRMEHLHLHLPSRLKLLQGIHRCQGISTPQACAAKLLGHASPL